MGGQTDEMGNSDEDDDSIGGTPTIIINELLASVQNAIMSGRLQQDIEESLHKCYGDTATAEALKVLEDNNIVGRRTSRRKDRKKDITEIYNAVRKEDWKNRNLKFAAVDFNNICHVPSGLGDELNLRMEIRELRNKFDDLIATWETVKQMTTSVQEMNDFMKKVKTDSDDKPLPPSYLNITKNLKEPSLQNAAPKKVNQSRPPSSPPLTQVIALRNATEQSAKTLTPNSQPSFLRSISQQNESQWQLVQRKRPKQKLMLGEHKGSNIQCVERPARKRTAIILASRFKPGTTAGDIESHVKSTVLNYELESVEEWKTKYDGYVSFKIAFLIGERKLGESLRDIIQVDKWPYQSLVKSFRPTSVYKNTINNIK